jgi:D-alanyl-D-alanine carboxypeptidase
MLVARSPDLGGYGLGIFGQEIRGKRGFGHSGFWGTVALYFPAEQVTIAVAATEQSQGGAIFGVLAAALAVVAP